MKTGGISMSTCEFIHPVHGISNFLRRFVDWNMFMCFRGGEIGYKAMRERAISGRPAKQ